MVRDHLARGVMEKKKLTDLLLAANLITHENLRIALGEQRRWGRPLSRVLVDLEMISEPDMVTVLSRFFGLPEIDLDSVKITPDVIAAVTEEVANRHHVVPFARSSKHIDIASSEEVDFGVLDEVRMRTLLTPRVFVAGPQAISRALQRYYYNPIAKGGRFIDALTMEGVAYGTPPQEAPKKAPVVDRDAEMLAMQERISVLEAQAARDEDVLRKLLALLVDKGLATREEILERLR